MRDEYNDAIANAAKWTNANSTRTIDLLNEAAKRRHAHAILSRSVNAESGDEEFRSMICC